MSKIKKCFITAFFVLMLFVLNQIDCFAGMDFTVTDEIISKSKNIAVEHQYFIITDASTVYLVVAPDNVSRIFIEGDRLYNYIDNNNNGYFSLYVLENNNWRSGGSHSSYNNASSFSFWYSTIDIMQETSGDTVFFWQTPASLEEVVAVEARKQTIMKEIAGCLKFLIPFLIFLLGFWKALRFVLRLLRQS